MGLMGIFLESNLPGYCTRVSHRQRNTHFIRKAAESKHWTPEAKQKPPWGTEPVTVPLDQELKQFMAWQGCQHFQELKTLNKRKINIQHLYKLQHYETVGHITQKNLWYLQSLIMRSLEKQWFFLTHLCCTIFYKERERECNCTETFGSVDEWNMTS